MIWKLHKLIRHFYTVLHAVESDIQEVKFEVLIQGGFFFYHSGNFQHQFLSLHIELVATVQQVIQNILGIHIGKMLDELELPAFTRSSAAFYPGRKMPLKKKALLLP